MTSPFFRSLRGRLLLVLLGLTALPALFIGGLAYQNARRTVETRVKSQLTSVADARLLANNFFTEEHFTEFLDPRKTFEQLLARLAQVSDEAFQAARQAWRENESPLHKVFRFRHDRAKFLKELERDWVNLPRQRLAQG